MSRPCLYRRGYLRRVSPARRSFRRHAIFFRSLTGNFDGSSPATRRRGGYSETLAGGQPGPAGAAPPAAFGTATRGSGSCGGCGSGGQPQCDASLAARAVRRPEYNCWARCRCGETLAGGQPGPTRAAPPAAFGVPARGGGSCGGCGSGGRPQRGANQPDDAADRGQVRACDMPATCLRLAYTVSCVVSEGEKGRGGRGGQGGRRGTKAAAGCSATCVPQAQGPGHQGKVKRECEGCLAYCSAKCMSGG